jgi:nucleoid-associated protein
MNNQELEVVQGGHEHAIVEVIVHGLVKEGTTFRVDEREAPLEVTDTARRVVRKLAEEYAKRTGKAHGRFEANEDNFPVQRYLREYYVDRSRNFLDLSRSMMQTLCTRANSTAATGGNVIIAHTVKAESHYLLVAILTEEWGASIGNDKALKDGMYLDLRGFRFAGQVNINDWHTNGERYLSFIKGRGQEKVADYFKYFLGCDHSVTAAKDTKSLVTALEEFGRQVGFNDAQKSEFDNKALKICTALAKNAEPLDLQQFANEVWPQNPEHLLAVLCAPELQLSDGFVPDRRVLKSLVKFEGKTKFWKIEFSRDAINSNEVTYNEDGSLTLRNLPVELKSRLEAELHSQDE